jgi:hypothetical protein
MKLRASDKSLFLFTHGRSVWFLGLKDLALVKTNEQKPSFACSVYPNPATHWLSVQTEDEIGSIQLFDADGRELNLQIMNNRVDLTPLNAGCYFVRIYNTGGNYIVKKFFKK